ncbi:MAG TPA: hypothetical protein VFB12_28870, partial [Ktedonobacteraceae bacterium]|nr:hypothetical protein [Ktedonobacteraceae bacterium]
VEKRKGQSRLAFKPEASPGKLQRILGHRTPGSSRAQQLNQERYKSAAPGLGETIPRGGRGKGSHSQRVAKLQVARDSPRCVAVARVAYKRAGGSAAPIMPEQWGRTYQYCYTSEISSSCIQ